MEKFLNFNRKIIDAYRSFPRWKQALIAPLLLTICLLETLGGILIALVSGVICIVTRKLTFKELKKIFKDGFLIGFYAMDD